MFAGKGGACRRCTKMQKTPDLTVHNRCFRALFARSAQVSNGYEPKGRGFESLLAYQIKPLFQSK